MSLVVSAFLGRRTLIIFALLVLLLLLLPAVFGRRVLGSHHIGIPFTYQSWSSSRPARATFDRGALVKNLAIYYVGSVCLSALWTWLRPR